MRYGRSIKRCVWILPSPMAISTNASLTTTLPSSLRIGMLEVREPIGGPNILFQIRTPELHAVKPNGYVMWNGCIILDHGLRNFPKLPVVLSSEIGGL